jgi:integrase
MAQTRIKTKVQGVRYREHDNRKHGLQFDRYFSIRYRVDGKEKEEGLGWASEGWTLTKSADTLAELKRNARTGEGVTTLYDKRKAAAAVKLAEDTERKRIADEKIVAEQAESDRIRVEHETIFNIVLNKYCESNSHKKSLKDEMTLIRLWVAPVVGSKRIQEITTFDIERIKRNMLKAGRAARSVEYTFAVIRQVFNYAKSIKLFTGESPTKSVKLPKADNRRMRFLSPDEARALLSELKTRSLPVYHMAILSLHAGLRLGEITKIKWQHINFEHRQLTLVDTKNGESRMAFMTDSVFQMFSEMEYGAANDLVFPSKNKNEIQFLSHTFSRVVSSLGLNDGVTDRRMKVVFHSLRHSCASHLAMNGADMSTIQAVLGHKTLAMAQRYAHLTDEHIKKSVELLQNVWNPKEAEVIPIGGRAG